MASYKTQCSGCSKKSCDCSSNEGGCSSNLCSSMPVYDAFNNPSTTDRILVSRSWLELDDCGRQTPRCQIVSIDSSQVNTTTDVCDQLGDIPTNPTKLCY